MKACNDGQRHKWTWMRNTNVITQTMTTKSYSLKGVYRCDKCGTSKYGSARVN